MAFNSGFPMNYQYYQPQFQQQPQYQNQQQTSDIKWVQGETGAKSFLVAPGNTVSLWDSENPVIYLKSADASGMPSMRIIDYTFRESQKVISADYATKKDLEELRTELKALLTKGEKDD